MGAGQAPGEENMKQIEEVTFLARAHKIFGTSRLSMSTADCAFEERDGMVLVRHKRGDQNVYEIPRAAVFIRYKEAAPEPKKK